MAELGGSVRMLSAPSLLALSGHCLCRRNVQPARACPSQCKCGCVGVLGVPTAACRIQLQCGVLRQGSCAKHLVFGNEPGMCSQNCQRKELTFLQAFEVLRTWFRRRRCWW